MSRWLLAAWRFFRDLSGESALERRMATRPCRTRAERREAYTWAVEEIHTAPGRRCC